MIIIIICIQCSLLFCDTQDCMKAMDIIFEYIWIIGVWNHWISIFLVQPNPTTENIMKCPVCLNEYVEVSWDNHCGDNNCKYGNICKILVKNYNHESILDISNRILSQECEQEINAKIRQKQQELLKISQYVDQNNNNYNQMNLNETNNNNYSQIEIVNENNNNDNITRKEQIEHLCKIINNNYEDSEFAPNGILENLVSTC